NQSVPIVALTAFFTGGVMLVQTGIFVRRFGATGLVGWAAGYSILPEIGPVLIRLMFSRRVGAHNPAALGPMPVTQHPARPRALAIDPTRYLIVPRVLAMMVTLLCLTVVGDLVAIVGAALFAKLLLGIEWGTFIGSFADNVKVADVLNGLVKSVFFGLAISPPSLPLGPPVRGGAVGVGRAVNAAVVAAAASIMLLDFFLTSLLK